MPHRGNVLSRGFRSDFEQVTAEFSKIDNATAVEFSHSHIFVRIGTAAVLEPLGLHAAENGIELAGAHLECIVMHFDGFAPVVEIKGGVFVDRNWNKRTVRFPAVETEWSV